MIPWFIMPFASWYPRSMGRELKWWSQSPYKKTFNSMSKDFWIFIQLYITFVIRFYVKWMFLYNYYIERYTWFSRIPYTKYRIWTSCSNERGAFPTNINTIDHFSTKLHQKSKVISVKDLFVFLQKKASK